MDRSGTYLFRLYDKKKFLGTAVLVSRRHLLSCAHVVKSAKTVTARADDFEDQAEVIGISPEDESDLALLRFAKDLHDPPLWSQQVAPGASVNLNGFVGTKGAPAFRSIPDRASPQFDRHGCVATLHVDSGARAGMSGGVAISLFGQDTRCVGLIQEGGKRAHRSLLLGAAEIAPFLARYQVSLPGCPSMIMDPPDPDAALRRQCNGDLHRRTAQVDIRGFQNSDGKARAFPIQDIYIPLSNTAREDIEQSVRKNRLLVVQGDAGSGKSTFLQQLAHKLAATDQDFPILIRVAELDLTIRKEIEASGTPAGWDDPRWLAVHAAAQPWNMHLSFVLRQLDRAETVVLLDGLDEALNEARRRSLITLFTRAAEQYRRCRFVVTTRPGAWRGQGSTLEFAVDTVAPLDDEARTRFFEKWYRCACPNDPAAGDRLREDLQRQVEANDEIREMADTPMMLTALASIHWNDKRLPEDRGELYQSVLTWLARSREHRPGRLGEKKCLQLLGALAFGMQTAAGGRLKQADTDTAIRILKDSAGLPAREAREFLAQEEMDSGIIVSRGEGMVEFRHLTYQEYLAAVELLENSNDDAAQRETLLRDRLRYSVEWREFLRLFAVLLRPKKAQWLFSCLLGAAGDSLADQARTVALIRRMSRDRREEEREIADGRYIDYVRRMDGLFEGKADGEGLDLWSRGEAAEAWELLVGDTSRLRLPGEAEYWERITESLELGRCPVTVFEYREYLKANPGARRPDDWEAQRRFPHRPVVYVSCFEAEEYCVWLSRTQNRLIRLPTEHEWYLAAGGAGDTKRGYPWGDEEPVHDRANYDYEIRHVSPVGLFPMGVPPGTKLNDMAGNVWEWTSSPWKEGYEMRVARGGSFYFSAWDLRAAFRLYGRPGGRDDDFGFRCLREVFP